MADFFEKISEKIKKAPLELQAYKDLYYLCKDDLKKGLPYLKRLSETIGSNIINFSELGDLQDLYELHRKVLLTLAPHDFESFMMYVEWNRDVDKKFYIPRRKALKPVVDALQDLAEDKLDLLAISLPPGVGKLISDDTPVYTDKGFKSHGDLKVGDYVLGLDVLKKVRVEHVFPKGIANCEVEFSNGEKIKCHGNHEWGVLDRETFEERLVTTSEMLEEGLRLEQRRDFTSHDYRFIVPFMTGVYGSSLSIKAICKIPPVQGNCIQVEGGFYRVGRTKIPTHNSTLAIFYITWLAGKKPNKPILTGSHSNSFVRGVYDECLRILDVNGEYLWGQVFPHLSISNTNAKDCRIDIDKRQRFETLEFTSIGTGNAGLYRAATLLYCDDLVSGIEVALSKERLDKLWETYTTDLRQRKIGNSCKELHIATRWSVHDVIGRLEQEYGDSDRAKFITVAAVDENDESNFKYPYDVGFSTEFYRAQREIMDEASWKALYMNEPIEREGLLYHADELRRYFELPTGEPDAIIGICDTKDKGKDYAFMPIGYVYGNDYYIHDCVCDNGLPDVVDARFVEILLKNNVQMCRFESNSAGGRIAEKVQSEVKNKGGITHITTKFTTANKETKIIVNSAWVKEHCLFKDESLYKRQDDYGKMMNMLTSYTVAGKNKHDDVPDGMAMFSEFAQNMLGSKVEVFKRPW